MKIQSEAFAYPKWKTVGKWGIIFLSVLMIFSLYQRKLAAAYEVQIVSWIGQTQENDMLQTIFSPVDEEAYKAGSRIMREAGYELSGRHYLRSNIIHQDRLFFVCILFCFCTAAMLWEIRLNSKKELHYKTVMENESNNIYEQMDVEKRFLQNERKKMGIYMENISHQLKTPLTGTLLCLENLTATETDIHRQKKLKDCIEQLDWMKEITVVLLRLAQIDAGKIWMRRKKENLSSLADDCVQRILPLLEEKNLTISVNLFPMCPLSCDAFWIKEALENVLKNAIEFTAPEGHIRVELSDCDSFYDLRIFNSGDKLPKEYYEVIFERFYQMDSGSRHGYGIGLNLSREIATLHQGTLKVLDTSETGTVFQFIFPKVIAKDHS